jgi:hypothetical protein
MPVSRPRSRLLSRHTREWLEAFAAALCLAAIVVLIGHAAPEMLP